MNAFDENTGGFSLSGGAVKIPKAGTYLISGVISGNSNTTSGYVQIRNTNGTIYESVLNRPSAARYTSISIPATICKTTANNQVVGLYNLDQAYNMNAGIDNNFRASTMTVVRLA